jgi:hypothetical protein
MRTLLSDARSFSATRSWWHCHGSAAGGLFLQVIGWKKRSSKPALGEPLSERGGNPACSAGLSNQEIAQLRSWQSAPSSGTSTISIGGCLAAQALAR